MNVEGIVGSDQQPRELVVYDESSPVQMGKTEQMRQLVAKLRAAGAKIHVFSFTATRPIFPGDKNDASSRSCSL